MGNAISARTAAVAAVGIAVVYWVRSRSPGSTALPPPEAPRTDGKRAGVEDENGEEAELLGDMALAIGLSKSEARQFGREVREVKLESDFQRACVYMKRPRPAAARAATSSEVKLKLYGLFKQATQGPCTTERPGLLEMRRRAMWGAWKANQGMSPAAAMRGYVDVVTQLDAEWRSAAGAPADSVAGDTSPGGGDVGSGVSMAPGQSTLASAEPTLRDDDKNILHFAAEGNVKRVEAMVASGVPVDFSIGSSGRVSAGEEGIVAGQTALHYASDSGHVDTVRRLLELKADVNRRDTEGQTPLHLAAICEEEDVARALVRAKADIVIKDNEGQTPLQIARESDNSELLEAMGVAIKSDSKSEFDAADAADDDVMEL